MNWTHYLVTAPTAEPIHKTEMKTHLKVDITDDDTLIEVYTSAARQFWEDITGRALVLQTRELLLDEWPTKDTMRLPRPPLRSVASVTYVDSAGTTDTMAAADYNVFTKPEPGEIVLDYGDSWPSETRRPGMAITAQYKCGYATPFTAAADTDILTAAGHTYSNGDAVRVYNSGGALPTGLSAATTYYAVGVSGDTLQLSTTSGGSAINITAAGSGSNFLGEIPATARAAIYLLTAHMYENREPVVIGSAVSELPLALQSLLALDKIHYVGPGD